MQEYVERRSLAVLAALTAMITCLALQADSQAQPKGTALDAGRQKKKGADTPAKKNDSDALKAREAQTLKEAYILLASAEHHYAGHRANAMKSVAGAANALVANVIQSPDVAPTIQTITVNNGAVAKAMAWEGRLFFDKYVMSDYHLNLARTMLTSVGAVMTANKQAPGPIKQVSAAVEEIRAALEVEASSNRLAREPLRARESPGPAGGLYSPCRGRGAWSRRLRWPSPQSLARGPGSCQLPPPQWHELQHDVAQNRHPA